MFDDRAPPRACSRPPTDFAVHPGGKAAAADRDGGSSPSGGRRASRLPPRRRLAAAGLSPCRIATGILPSWVGRSAGSPLAAV